MSAQANGQVHTVSYVTEFSLMVEKKTSVTAFEVFLVLSGTLTLL